MSVRDRELLTAAGLSQTRAAELLGIKLQGVNRGVSSSCDYFTDARVKTLLDGLGPEQAEALRSAVRKVKASEHSHPDAQALSLVEVLTREEGGIIWLPLDAVRRIEQEAHELRKALREGSVGRLTLVVVGKNEQALDLIRSHFLSDLVTFWREPMVIIGGSQLGVHPEMLIGARQVFVRTDHGFQSIPDQDAGVVFHRLLDQSGIAPNRPPRSFPEEFELLDEIAASPFERIRSELLRLMEEQEWSLNEQDGETIKKVTGDLTRQGPTPARPIDGMIKNIPEALGGEVGDRTRDILHMLKLGSL